MVKTAHEQGQQCFPSFTLGWLPVSRNIPLSSNWGPHSRRCRSRVSQGPRALAGWIHTAAGKVFEDTLSGRTDPVPFLTFRRETWSGQVFVKTILFGLQRHSPFPKSLWKRNGKIPSSRKKRLSNSQPLHPRNGYSWICPACHTKMPWQFNSRLHKRIAHRQEALRKQTCQRASGIIPASLGRKGTAWLVPKAIKCLWLKQGLLKKDREGEEVGRQGRSKEISTPSTL